MHVITFFRISFIIVGFFSVAHVRASGCPLVVDKNGAVNVICTHPPDHEKVESLSKENASKGMLFDGKGPLPLSHGWHEQGGQKNGALKEKEHKNKELMDNLRAIP